MLEELAVLKEYFESLGLNNKEITQEDLFELKTELKDAGEFGLADLISKLKDPKEILDYIGEEE